jgi:hypothetical protein
VISGVGRGRRKVRRTAVHSGAFVYGSFIAAEE